jgi:hypothetical protein
MLPALASARARMLGTLRHVVTAAGELDEERSRRLAQIEKLYGAASAAATRPGRAGAPAPARRARGGRKEQRK